MEQLIYQTSPVVTLATNRFINVPIIFQYEDTPLIVIVKEQSLGYTSSIPIYDSAGTCLAKINGTRIFPTAEGKTVDIQIEKRSLLTICKIGSRTAFEIHHQPGDAFRIVAELYAPDGYFVKFEEQPQPKLLDASGNAIKVGGVTMIGNTIENLRIGVWLKKDGSCLIGVS